MKSQRCIWCGWSLVRATLDGIKTLCKWADDWDFFIKLSGQDCALQSQWEIKTYLETRSEANFMFILPLSTWPRGMVRIKYYNVEIPLKMLYPAHDAMTHCEESSVLVLRPS